MVQTRDFRTGRRDTAAITPDELLVHLREGGAKRVYLSRTEAFRDGTIPVVATYPVQPSSGAPLSGGGSIREMLVEVFEAIGGRCWFRDDEWALEWNVEPAFSEQQLDLLPIYDRGIEQKFGDGFVLRNLHVVYEEYTDGLCGDF